MNFKILFIISFTLYFTPALFARDPGSAEAEVAEFKKLIQETKPAYDQAQAEALLKAAAPVVQEITQKKLTAFPQLKLATRDGLLLTLIKDLLPQLKALKPNSDQMTLELDAAEITSKTVSSLIAKYSTSEKIIYLAPGNIKPLMNLAGAPEDEFDNFLQVALIFELCYLLQDQYADLTSKLASIKNYREVQLLNVVKQGFAVMVTTRAAEKLNLQSTLHLYNSVMPHGDAFAKRFPILAKPGAEHLRQMRIIYELGHDYMIAQFNQGGIKAVWKACQQPPSDLNALKTYDSKNLLAPITSE